MLDEDKTTLWDKKAETFPRYEAGEHTYEAGVLNTIKSCGVDFCGKTVLDVGCGTGMFTLRIAREARSVTAVDISGRMLEILREDAARLGLENIDCVRSDWENFHGEAGRDIVFCSMTPAIKSEESRRKLLACAGDWTIFLGFAGVMSSNILNALYAEYEVTPRVFDNGTEMRRWLDGRGVSHIRRLLEGQWVKRRGLDETIADCASMLRPYSVSPERADMERSLARFEEEPGVYVERTDYKIDLLLWRREAADAAL